MRIGSVVLLAMALAAGCKDNANEAAAAPVPAAAAPQGLPSLPTLPGAAAAPEAPAGLKGKVLEKIEASTYSYLRLQAAEGEIWAAVPQTATAVGADVEIVNASRMDGFESKTLNRKFDRILFGQLKGEQPAAPEAAPMAAPQGMPAGHAAVDKGPADSEPIKVDKAPGATGRTVAELHGQKAQLKDAKVSVRGKVVKASNGIMGKNWLHLRDGTGTPEAKDNDITVTTQGTAAVGDVVTVDGVLRTDKDFGAGYAYGVIVEEASVRK